MQFPSGSRPSTEVGLIAALARHILGDEASEELLKDILRLRHHVDGAPEELTTNNALLKGDMGKILAEDEDEDSDVERQLDELREQRERKLARQEKQVQEAVRAGRAMGIACASASPGAADPAAGPRPRRFVPIPERGPSLEEGRRFLPAGFALSKDTRRDNRWRIRGPGFSEKTKSFGPMSGRSEWEPCAFC